MNEWHYKRKGHVMNEWHERSAFDRRIIIKRNRLSVCISLFSIEH